MGQKFCSTGRCRLVRWAARRVFSSKTPANLRWSTPALVESAELRGRPTKSKRQIGGSSVCRVGVNSPICSLHFLVSAAQFHSASSARVPTLSKGSSENSFALIVETTSIEQNLIGLSGWSSRIGGRAVGLCSSRVIFDSDDLAKSITQKSAIEPTWVQNARRCSALDSLGATRPPLRQLRTGKELFRRRRNCFHRRLTNLHTSRLQTIGRLDPACVTHFHQFSRLDRTLMDQIWRSCNGDPRKSLTLSRFSLPPSAHPP